VGGGALMDDYEPEPDQHAINLVHALLEIIDNPPRSQFDDGLAREVLRDARKFVRDNPRVRI
jgi:hypothetical protein